MFVVSLAMVYVHPPKCIPFFSSGRRWGSCIELSHLAREWGRSWRDATNGCALALILPLLLPQSPSEHWRKN